MKISMIIAIGMCVLGGVACAFNPPPKLTPEQKAAFQAHQGGLVMPKDNGYRVLVWDASGKATAAVATFTNHAHRLWHIPMIVKTGPADAKCLYKAAKSAKSEKTPCVVFIGEGGADVPALGVYPEEAIGCVNYSVLACSNAVKTQKRLEKELFRAFGFALGGYSFTRMACAMDLVYSIDDLDAMNAILLAPVRFSGINRSASKLNLPVLRSTTYQMAVRQGWAPPPTNEVQKAIWEKNKDLPPLQPGNVFPQVRPVKR